MTPPVTIPEEVMAKAMWALSVPEHEMVDSVSRAILSAQEEQREKDAKIVRGLGKVLTDFDVPLAGALLESIAAAIREGR